MPPCGFHPEPQEENRPRIQPKSHLNSSRDMGETIADELLIERLCDKLIEKGKEQFVRRLISSLEKRKDKITKSELDRRFRRRDEQFDKCEARAGFSSRLSKHHKYLDSHSRSKAS